MLKSRTYCILRDSLNPKTHLLNPKTYYLILKTHYKYLFSSYIDSPSVGMLIFAKGL